MSTSVIPGAGRASRRIIVGSVFVTLFLAGAVLAEERVAGSSLPLVAPADAGMNAETFARIDAEVAEALDDGEMAGAVVLIARRGNVAHLKAYGDAETLPDRVPMTVDRVFDLASLTKPLATGLAVMKLVEEGKLSLDDPVAKHWPEFAAEGKETITIRDLLTHQGGLIADNGMSDYDDGRAESLAKIAALEPLVARGERFIYSDVGFIVLGRVVERVSGMREDAFVAENFYRPLALTATGYVPDETLCARAVPTERRDDAWMKGDVHDPRAYAMDGVAGHAGLFSTAGELAILGQTLLSGGEYGGVRILKPETVETMTKAYETPRGVRGLSWDKDSPYSTNGGDRLSPAAFGHGGFTGTSFWVDPERELIVIFLSSRLHPDGKGSVNPLAGRIADLAVEAIEGDTPRPTVP